jgi:outer membrane PBP1 activator LpoA protein
MRILRHVMIVIAALALAGCTQVLDDQELESEISSGIEEQTEATGVSVSCPSDVPLEQGNTFTCSATSDQGDIGQVQVTQTDDEGNVNWELNA